MKLVNRLAVIVSPKQPYLDWATEVDWTSSTEEEVRETLSGPPSVYLAGPDVTEAAEASISEETARSVFEAKLATWHDDEADWPSERGLEALREWFNVELQGMVIDLEGEALDLEHL